MKIVAGVPIENGKFQWNKCIIGDFITVSTVNGESYSFKILGYSNRVFTLENIFGKEINILSNNLYRGHIEKLITNKSIVEVGDVVNTKQENATLLSTQNGKFKFRCENCSYVYDKTDSQMSLLYSKGIMSGCAVCSGQKVVKGINDIATTRPDIAKYFLNVSDSEKYSHKSGMKILTKCPYCKNISENIIGNLSTRGFSCIRCGDNISFPERVFMSLWEHLSIKYIGQLSKKHFRWVGAYKYDFYIVDFNMIVEVHGGFHYRDTKFTDSKQVKLNDESKRVRALSNGVSKYISIDCSKSDLSFIRDNILKSKLLSILRIDSENINWEKVLENSYCKNTVDSVLSNFKKTGQVKETSLLVNESEYLIRKKLSLLNILPPKTFLENENTILKLWENGERDTLAMSEIINITRGGVTRILKKLDSKGLIDYKSVYLKTRSNPVTKKVTCLNDNKEFNSLKECALHYNQTSQNISRWIKKERNCTRLHSNGEIYNFKYAN